MTPGKLVESHDLMLFPAIGWWTRMIGAANIALEIAVPFRKMEGYNRYRIAGANGPLLLSVPIAGGREQRILLKEVRIDANSNWQKQHWRSIFSAYGRAPFFEHYAPSLEALLHRPFERLVDLNLAALEWTAAALKQKIIFTTVEQGALYRGFLPFSLTYAQVFADRHGFIPDLSILDLLMNEGPTANALLLEQYRQSYGAAERR